MDNKREIWLDWLRVVACFLVMLTHSTEPFYLGGKGSLILTHSDAVWAAVFNFSAAVLAAPVTVGLLTTMSVSVFVT